MKKLFTTFTYLTLAVTLSLSAQVGNNNRLLFVANMDGGQEVPAITTDGRGVVSFLVSEDLTTLNVHGVFSLLSGPITACHIHSGIAGTAGGVYLNFTPNITGNELRASMALPSDFFQKALTKELYFNVHTAANPAGEIRGQLELQTQLFFTAGLSGDEETPSVDTDGSGVGFLRISHGIARYTVVVNGLTGPATAAHIHDGAAGSAGGVVVGLTSVSSNLYNGQFDLSAVPPDFLQKLENEGLYMNVHTAANPTGEIRGQLRSLGPIQFEATMNGDQETPPVATSAFGLAVAGISADLSTLNYLVVGNGLTPTAGHFHMGAVGTAGGVLVPFQSGNLPNFYKGTTTLPNGMATALLNSEIYANLHTAANPGGAIRGQVIPEIRNVYAFDVCGDQEVPSTGSNAVGSAVVTHDWLNTDMDYLYIMDGLSGPATAAHIHTGAIGVPGSVIIPLNIPSPVAEGVVAFDGGMAAMLASGDTYLNVHTANFPAGEVRGQVQLGTLCALTSTDFVSSVSGLTVFPNPASGRATVRFQSEIAFEGNLTLFNLTGQQVSSQTMSVGTGETSVEIKIGNWPAGMYFGQMKSTDGSAISFKLVKE